MERETTCCFTGHRPEKLPWGRDETDARCLKLKECLAEEIRRLWQVGVRHFICGMARGVDTYFCEAVLAFRQTHSDVTIEASIPCESQAERWPEVDRDRYFHLVEQCDFETLIQHKYDPGCMHRRNRYMVDHSARIVAVYDGTMGGTMRTLLYAQRKGLDTVIIDLDLYK